MSFAPEHRTCDICGGESPVGDFAATPTGTVHRGACHLEYGLIQNTLPDSGMRSAVQRLGAMLRERGDAWKAIAERQAAEIQEYRAALFIAPCLCSTVRETGIDSGFICSRCKALAQEGGQEQEAGLSR